MASTGNVEGKGQMIFYSCEMWSFTLREEHKLQVFKYKVLRKIYA
jgi:hypothetical protein